MASDPPGLPNGRYALGRLTEAVDRIEHDIRDIREDVRDLSKRLAAVEKHVEDYPGRFLMESGPKAQQWDKDHSWIVTAQAKAGVIIGGLAFFLAVLQVVAGYVLSQWIINTFDLRMIHR